MNEEMIRQKMLPYKEERLKTSLANHYIKEKNIKAADRELKNDTYLIAKYYLMLGEKYEEAKYWLSVSAMMHEYYNKTYNEPWVPAPILNLLSISDHTEVLLRLCKMRKIEYYQDSGGQLGWTNANYQIIEGDWEGLKDTVVYLKNIRGSYTVFDRPELYLSLLEGFINKDQCLIESVLDEFETPDEIEKRKKQDEAPAFVSILTLAMAKQAWRHGIQVWQYHDQLTLNHPLVPKELVPYEPLKEYSIPFKFLKEFYRKEGIKWKYAPIHPEIQGETAKGFWGRLFNN
jgi:hypothetical protein